MAKLIEGVRPTRMELLNLRRKTSLAKKGYRLLKEKRDSLVMEFMKLSKKAVELSGDAREDMGEATRLMAESKGLMGSPEIGLAGRESITPLETNLKFRNIMGVKAPMVETNLGEYTPSYSLYWTHPILDDTSQAYRSALEKLLELTEYEGGLRALKDETKKTKRRVNALEHRRIPQLEETMKYIQLRLDELERENYYRLKMVKRKKEK